MSLSLRASRAPTRTATSRRSAVADRTPAVALAAALKADECQIYTDVDGVPPPTRASCRKRRSSIRSPSREMLEMASLGSKVLQIRSVEFAGKYKVKLRVLSSFTDEGEGTLITVEEDKSMEQPIISGIAFNRDEAKLTVLGVPDRPGIAYQILGSIADAANIDVDMIIQNVGHDGTTGISVPGEPQRIQQGAGRSESVKSHIGAREIVGDNKICKVSVVGVGMRFAPGVASQMFRCSAAEEGINLQMIWTSEIKISVVVDEKYSNNPAVGKVFRTRPFIHAIRRPCLTGGEMAIIVPSETWPRGQKAPLLWSIRAVNLYAGSNPSVPAAFAGKLTWVQRSV